MQGKKRMGKGAFVILSIVICLFCAGICFGLGIVAGAFSPWMTQTVKTMGSPTARDEDAGENSVADLRRLKAAFERGEISGEVYLIKSTEPSVVDLKIQRQSRDFFDMLYNMEEEGTGIIFHQTGETLYIVTNHHVVENASSVTASINDGNYVNTMLIGKDTNSNLAVLSVSKQELGETTARNIIVAKFGDSDDVSIGDPVIAIGNSEGNTNAATKGVVSAVNKKVLILNRYLNVLQTDAAINTGYNGGPLISQYGDIIGINTAMLSTSAAIEGTGYSIASNDAKRVIEQIMNNEGTPFLGIHMANVSGEMAAYYGIPQVGVYIIDVVEGGSADLAGLQAEDIITGFNGKPIFSTEQLVEEVRNCVVSQEVDVKVIRGGNEPVTITLVLMANQDTSF